MLTKSGTKSSSSSWIVSCGCETLLEPTIGKVMKVEFPKMDPLF